MLPELNEEFLMEFPLPPHLSEKYERDTLIVEAVYEGRLKDEDVEVQKEDGSLKEMYNRLDLSEHHIVRFGGDRWVNDLLEFDPSDVSVRPII